MSSITEPARETPIFGEFEIVVLGGGPAGIAAAAASGALGRKVLLIERYGFLGGMGTAAGVTNFCGLHANVHGDIRQVVHGVADDLLARGGQNVRAAGATVNLPIFSGGALVGNYDIARAQAEQAALAYRRSVLVALQEVSDALIAFDHDRAEAQGNRDRVAVNGEALRLAQLRFRCPA